MKKILAVLAVVLVLAVVIPVFADDTVAPAPSKDYKELEGGRWEIRSFHYISGNPAYPSGFRNYFLEIKKVEAGKISGEYVVEVIEGKDTKSTIREFNSDVKSTSEGLLRLTIPGVSQGYIWADQQGDGSFRVTIGAVLKRVR
jgi:hypothetical protein